MATRLAAPQIVVLQTPSAPQMSRLDSVDLLRGIVMVLMALDHTRDFLTHLRFAPENMAHTWPALFFTRWVTHFCAPLFFFLAGTGAFLSTRRGRSPTQLSHFLWTRGLWLVVVELTIVDFAFVFSFHPQARTGAVIWSLGWCMVLMAAVVRLPVKWLAAGSLVMIFGHNLLDGIRPQQFGSLHWIWTILHAPGLAWSLPHQFRFFVSYVLVPWVGVMALGYAFGAILQQEGARRRRVMVAAGVAAVALFCLLRATNIFGNPPTLFMDSRSSADFHLQSTAGMTVVSFLNVEKYPPSLQFLLMTLGPGLLALALLDRYNDRLKHSVAAPLVVIGRVPLFFYIVHIYVIHLAAIAIAVAFGQPAKWLLWGAFAGIDQLPKGYGHNLPFIYLVWALICVALYFPCRWFAALKRRRRDLRWLSYL